MENGQDSDTNELPKNDETPIVKGKKEELYDKIPLTKKQLDIIIVILIAAIVLFLVFGALIGNGIL